jgi:glycosyltransferase involved in cell wall biosynthesis
MVPVSFQIDEPYFATVWDLQHRLQPWFPEVSSWGRWRYRENALREVLQRAVAVITPNRVGKEELIQFYDVPPDRITCLAHPTPSFALKNAQGRAIDSISDRVLPERFLLYPAQFWPHKNHVNLIAALKLLKDRDGIVIKLVLVGSDAGNLAHVQNVVESWQMQDSVTFLGFVSRSDLIYLYQNAFALTYLSYFGPENLPPLEAFALGCPVIASAVTGSKEQYGEAALLVDPTNVEAIAAAIKLVHENPRERDALVARGHARAQRWTAKDYVAGVLKMLDEFEPIRRCWPVRRTV